MCVIAAYAGNRQAAPILIEMLKKMEYIDGGLATGIATVHEGKLHVAKALGDVEMLLRTTDSLNLPGTVGIIHSRPSGGFFSTTHPYIDASGKLAMVENGVPSVTGCPEFYAELRRVMDELLDEGIHAYTGRDLKPSTGNNSTKDGKAFYYIEAYSQLLGYRLRNIPEEQMKVKIAEEVKKMHERMPADNITVSIHSSLPDTITVGTVTRPFSVLEADGETFGASIATAFPEELLNLPVTHLPHCSVSQLTPNGFKVIADELEGVRTEQVSDRIKNYYREQIENKLKGKESAPLCVHEFNVPMDIWSEPAIACRYSMEGRYLKPSRSAVYQVLWDLHKEGRLHSKLGRVYARDFAAWPFEDKYFTKYWLD